MTDIPISFNYNDVEHFLSFFNTFGYVVIKDILSPDEINQSINELWHSPNLLKSVHPDVSMEDPSTWINLSYGPNSKGFVDSKNLWDDKQAWENRQNEKLVQVFQHILGKKEIYVNLDRHGVLLPTKNIKYLDGSIRDHPEWTTAASWLHWDQNPWREPEFCRVQGLVTLTDHTETSGGFCCVPGFQKRFKQWSLDNPIETVSSAQFMHSLVTVPPSDGCQDEVKKIIMKAGSLLIWDSRLPHQNYPNQDSNWRMVQYITFLSIEDKTERITLKQNRNNLIKTGIIKKDVINILTPLGKKIAGLCLWDDNEDEEAGGSDFSNIKELTQDQIDALRYLDRAVELEQSGDISGAVIMYKKAYKLNPELEYN